MSQEAPFRPQAPAKKDNTTSCLVIGCVSVAGIGILAIIGIAVALAVGLPMMLNALVDNYTTDEPLELPVVAVDEGEYDALRARMDAFGDAIDAGESVASLTLTAEEINAILQSEPDFAEAGGQVYVEITADDRITGQVSLPIGQLLPDLETAQGRYLNGEATFTVGVLGGRLFVGIDELSVNGQMLPEEFMQGMKQENIAEGFMENPEARRVLEQISDIRVKDGAIHIIPKNQAPASETEPEEAAL